MDLLRTPFKGVVADVKEQLGTSTTGLQGSELASYGMLTTVETLASTAICGIIHSILGGQPLLIVGVAEPTITMVCIWTAIMLFLLAMFNASNVISRFTRVAGELFGMLIIVLFQQEAIKGVISEFSVPEDADHNSAIYQFQWIYVNCLPGVIFSIGLLYTALRTRRAGSWLYGLDV